VKADDNNKQGFTLVLPSWKDPRVMMVLALTLWTILGQKVYFFNTTLEQIAVCVGITCALELILTAVLFRAIMVPLSALLTGLSICLLLESTDIRVFICAGVLGILSKYLLRDGKSHFFNPSNFALVVMLLIAHGSATIAPGSQWGADYRISLAILAIGMTMMIRVKRVELALAWIGGYVLMSLLRVIAGQGGLVFALGPMTGAEFALFTFSMLPDPKASPTTKNGRIFWALSIAVLDGIMRYMEIRFSMFYALFIHTAILPIMRRVAEKSGAAQADPWKLIRLRLRSATPEPAPVKQEA